MSHRSLPAYSLLLGSVGHVVGVSAQEEVPTTRKEDTANLVRTFIVSAATRANITDVEYRQAVWYRRSARFFPGRAMNVESRALSIAPLTNHSISSLGILGAFPSPARPQSWYTFERLPHEPSREMVSHGHLHAEGVASVGAELRPNTGKADGTKDGRAALLTEHRDFTASMPDEIASAATEAVRLPALDAVAPDTKRLPTCFAGSRVRDTIVLHREPPTRGVMPRVVASNAGASCVNYTTRKE